MPLDFRPNFEKIIELLLYLAHKRPNADKYQAVKFFYLADKEHLSRYGRPITFEQYCALPYGPVASNAMDLLEGDRVTMSRAGIDKLPFKTELRSSAPGKKPIVYIKEPLRSVNLDIFSKSDILVFDEIISKYGNKTFDELFNLTHKHYAYLHAWNNKIAGTKQAKMRYEDMIDDERRRAEIVEDLSPISAYLG